MCFDFSTNLSEIFFSLKRIKLNIITNVQFGLHVQWQLFLSDFNKTLISFSYFHKIITNFMKYVLFEPSFSMQMDGRADRRTRRS